MRIRRQQHQGYSVAYRPPFRTRCSSRELIHREEYVSRISIHDEPAADERHSDSYSSDWDPLPAGRRRSESLERSSRTHLDTHHDTPTSTVAVDQHRRPLSVVPEASYPPTPVKATFQRPPPPRLDSTRGSIRIPPQLGRMVQNYWKQQEKEGAGNSSGTASGVIRRGRSRRRGVAE